MAVGLNVKRDRYGDGRLDSDTRDRLLRALTKASHVGKQFHRFLDLPPELRTRVYEFYVAAFPENLLLPVCSLWIRIMSIIG